MKISIILISIIVVIFFIFFLKNKFTVTQKINCDKIKSLKKELLSGTCIKNSESYNLCCFRENSFIDCDKNNLKINDIVKLRVSEKIFPENTTKICYNSDLINLFDIYDFCNSEKEVLDRKVKCETFTNFGIVDFYFIGLVQQKKSIELINISFFSNDKNISQYLLKGFVND